MTDRWGASPEDWAHFDLMLGLTADLLPVVSNPDAKISEDSRMKGLGKTPSAYNNGGYVAGIKDWTDRQTTPAMVEKWSKQDDYGICVQTRLVRGLDVDVPDPGLSARIAAHFLRSLERLGENDGQGGGGDDRRGYGLRAGSDGGGEVLVGRSDLPARRRAGTGKQLLGFTLAGDYRKRSFKVDGGLVEFLAGGQQFVAIGTHPSGTRYDWVGGLPRDFPEVQADDFERAWAAIVEEFAVEPERRALVRSGAGGDGLCDIHDDVGQWLEANWETFGSDGGKLYVACPWKDGHSSDSGETEASWMLAGTGGYAQGHFVCLHASCSGRTDQEFFKAVGRKPADKADFTPVARAEAAGSDPVALYLAAAAGAAEPPVKASTKVKTTAPHPKPSGLLPLPGFERDKQGVILATLGNVAKAIGHPQMAGVRLRYDTFRDEMVVASLDAEDWRPFRDADAVRLRIAIAERNCEEIGRELMRDALALVAVENEFDTAIHWLETVVPEWDGQERVSGFYPDYFKTDDTAYTRAVGEYVWTAHVGRIMEPGCQADMAPILIGAQGLLKSSGVMAISPAEDFFKKFDLKERDDDQSRKMRGVLVGEFDEMRGLNGRGAEEIRSFMTKRWEDWTPKFKEYATKFPRRLLFHGTGNEDEILNDPTGERRWLPMTVNDRVDVERIKADRLQLWAEGLALWTADGVRWREAERLAKEEHGSFKVTDAWDKDVVNWLSEEDVGGRTPLTRAQLKVADVLVGALGFEVARITKADEMRMAKVLVGAGLQKVVTKLDGRTVKTWRKAK